MFLREENFMKDLEGKVVFVIGVVLGIGFGIVILFV